MCCENEMKLARAALTLIERADLKGAEVSGYMNVKSWLESILRDNQQALELQRKDKAPGPKGKRELMDMITKHPELQTHAHDNPGIPTIPVAPAKKPGD